MGITLQEVHPNIIESIASTHSNTPRDTVLAGLLDGEDIEALFAVPDFPLVPKLGELFEALAGGTAVANAAPTPAAVVLSSCHAKALQAYLYVCMYAWAM